MYTSMGGDSFDVNINYPGGSVIVRVSSSWNVARVKEEVARKANLSAGDFRIVFAGNALDDGLQLNVIFFFFFF